MIYNLKTRLRDAPGFLSPAYAYQANMIAFTKRPR